MDLYRRGVRVSYVLWEHCDTEERVAFWWVVSRMIPIMSMISDGKIGPKARLNGDIATYIMVYWDSERKHCIENSKCCISGGVVGHSCRVSRSVQRTVVQRYLAVLSCPV